MAATDGGGKGRSLKMLVAGLGALTASSARGEDTVDFKLLHYRESDGRTEVTNPELYYLHDFGAKGQVGLLLGYDSISGASPTGEASTLDATASASSAASAIPMANYSDTRQAASLTYTNRFGSHLPAVTLSWSRESDYSSNGLSLVDGWDLFGGRSTLHLGVGATQDRIEPVTLTDSFSKKSVSFSAGWTQVLGPRDLLDLSFGVDRLNGYLTDPYKLVTVGGVAMPEARPETRLRRTAVLKYGHYFMAR
ncbi:MAG TPA: DUF3570 domain-containing protein, partial [Candidatus Polarisedimenticolia bacterium]|nr:DUF3570 domain-containing protein [Candidatus Polarisedimenticolia bacterium]